MFLVVTTAYGGKAEVCTRGTLNKTGEMMRILMFTLGGSTIAKLRPTSKSQLDDMAARLGITTQLQLTNRMRSALAAAASEQAIVDVASDTLRSMFPSASGIAAATFAQSSGPGSSTVAKQALFAETERARAALEAALPDGVCAERAQPAEKQTSVWTVCHNAGQRVTIADSRDFYQGVKAFADW